ncbi:MAG: aspartate/glutamate racemase family protein [Geminicoccales bacterium]
MQNDTKQKFEGGLDVHIGLIGGIGPAATDLYYRGLVDTMKARKAKFDLTIVHADAPTLVQNIEARRPEAQADIFLGLTERLATAGADFVAITSIGGHFCIEQFRPRSALPVVSFIEEINTHLAMQGYNCVGLLGTDTVMKTRLYGGVTGADILIPPSEAIDEVHRAYVNMAIEARVTDTQRKIFNEAGRKLAARGAETILLGGTDLFLAFHGQAPGFETLDCADVHIEAIARVASSADQFASL